MAHIISGLSVCHRLLCESELVITAEGLMFQFMAAHEGYRSFHVCRT